MTALTDLQEAQKEIQTKIYEHKKELQEIGGKLFREGAQDIFDTFPELESFSWTQYTPYFNDGEECVFGVNDYFNVTLTNGDVLEEVYDSPYLRERKRNDGVELDLEDNLGVALSGLVGSVDEETMKNLFGDHVEVTVTRNGIEVNEYEHY